MEKLIHRETYNYMEKKISGKRNKHMVGLTVNVDFCAVRYLSYGVFGSASVFSTVFFFQI